MKQLIQYFKSGELELLEAPVPKAGVNNLVIESETSLISVGTEKMLLNFGKASLIQKAKQQPDKVKQVLNKIRTEGLISTAEAVWSKLNEPIPLGYSNVGKVHEIGNNVVDFNIGDRVVSNGPHAEFVKVIPTLVAKIPQNVENDQASFTVLGTIALQGIRLLKPEIGETVVVVGLGLLGQLTLQLLNSNGCHAIGIDVDKKKVELAKSCGFNAIIGSDADNTIQFVLDTTNGKGADGVIITASTNSEELLSQCALMSKQRGKIILIGVAPINVPRALFYEKELTFQVSSAYGPGRYDPSYEEKGIDYPFGYVRWTAGRNMQAFLYLLSEKKIDVTPLITHHFDFDKIQNAYTAIETENPLGIIVRYNKHKKPDKKIKIDVQNFEIRNPVEPVIGFIGVGNFAKMILLPALKIHKANLKTISSSGGLNAAISAKKFNFKYVVSDSEEIFNDTQINTVFISTRHASHASLVLKSIESGKKNIFVEKPLAMTLDELNKIAGQIKNIPDLNLMVGFNRRFAPVSKKLSQFLTDRSNPISVIITVNSGALPANHWTHDPETGGGRIIGEGCHFVDLARFLVNSEIESVSAIATRGHSETDEDKVIALLSFKDGSNASIHYLANGNKSFPKERVEVFASGNVFQIDNFKSLRSFGASLHYKSYKQDKGHSNEIREFIESIIKGEKPLISFAELLEIHLATLAINKSVQTNKIVLIKDMWEQLD